MKIAIRWALLPAAIAAGYLASRLRRTKRRNDRTAYKAELNEWENEGGNVAQPPGPPSALETTRSA